MLSSITAANLEVSYDDEGLLGTFEAQEKGHIGGTARGLQLFGLLRIRFNIRKWWHIVDAGTRLVPFELMRFRLEDQGRIQISFCY